MALTPEELVERRSYMGGSDIPPLLGLSPYQNITDLWLSKTGRLEVKDEAPSRPADLGSRLEPALVQLAADTRGHPVEFNRRFTRPDAEFKSCQTDGWLTDVGEPVEAKCIGLWNSRFSPHEWGTEGTDEVPYSVLVQVVWQLHVSDADVGHISALLGAGLGHRLYRVKALPALAAEIDERVERFWTEHVLADVAPELPASLSAYREVIREPESITEVDEALPFEYENALVQVTDATKERDRVKAKVLQQMGDAEVGYTPYGSFSYRADKRGRRTFRLHAAG